MSYTLAYTGAEIDALLGKIDAIFVAEYGSTIYSEVTAAIAAGNKVIVANAGKVFVYAGTDDNSGYVFTQSGPNAQSPSVTYATLSTGNVWSTDTGALPSITYVDSAVATEQARAESVEAGKADSDGIYPDLTAGTALQLLGNTYTEDKTPYNFRKSGGSVKVGTREKDKIVGGTIAWNQLIQNGNFADDTVWTGFATSTYSHSNNVGRCQAVSTSGTQGISVPSTKVVGPAGHKYLCSLDIYADTTGVKFGASLNASSLNTDNVFAQIIIPTSWETIATITSPSSAVAGFRIATYTGALLAQGDSFYVRNVCLFDLTQMFGSTIADYIYSLETANAGAGVAYFRSLFPKPYYDYNTGALMSVKTSAHNMTGKNLFDVYGGGYIDNNGAVQPSTTNTLGKGIKCKAGQTFTVSTSSMTGAGYAILAGDIGSALIYRQGSITVSGNKGTFTVDYDGVLYLWAVSTATDIQLEYGSTATPYEPYELHSYPLDADLELRGIPKLDANNALYYDGDIYEADGSVERRYGIVDMGTLAWVAASSAQNTFYAPLYNISAPAKRNASVICGRYAPSTAVFTAIPDKAISANADQFSTSAYVFVHDSAYSDADAFKAAMSGVYLLYELATPTTEEADPYAEIQIVSPYGTEEYVDERAVAIPVGHDTQYPTDLVAKIEEIPDPPTADGTYTLKASVSGGSVTYSWEA